MEIVIAIVILLGGYGLGFLGYRLGVKRDKNAWHRLIEAEIQRALSQEG